MSVVSTKTVYDLVFKVQDSGDMSNFGDYDYRPKYTKYVVGHFHSPKVAMEHSSKILDELSKRNDELTPLFLNIVPYTIKYLDEEISEDQASTEYNEIIEKINQSEHIKRHRRIPFGKYKGHEVSEICKTDKKYIKWLTENTNFKLNEYEESLI